MKTKNKLLSLAALSAGAVATTALINKCIKISSTSKYLLLESQSLCYKWRFGNIYYTREGSGSPLLLVHSLDAASSSYEWTLLKNHLKEFYTIYTLDLLGCGRSEKPDLTYTNYLYVQLLSDFIKSEIGHRTDIIAAGGACALAIMACNNSPELFNRLMLINPDSLLTCSQIPGKYAKFYKLILDLPVLGTLLYHMAVSRQAITGEFTKHYFYNPYSVKTNMIDSYREAAHLGKSPKSLYASVTCNYTKCNIMNALKKIDNSIFLIGGAEENHIVEKLEEYKSYNPAVEYAIIPKSKQLPQLENPLELLKSIRMFFC